MTTPKSATYQRRINSAKVNHASKINHVPLIPEQPIVREATPRKPSKIAKWWAKGHRVTLTGRGKWLVVALIALTFFGGLALGEKRAQQSPDFHKPSATTLGVLHYAQESGGKGCKIVWNETHAVNEVVCDHPVQLVNQDPDHDPQK